MTTPSERQDQQWGRALDGSPDPQADPLLNRQAAALRKALQARRDAMDPTVPPADESLYKAVRRRLHHEPPGRIATSWKKILAFALSAFVLGLAVARLTMLPTMPAMRSTGTTPPTPVSADHGVRLAASLKRVSPVVAIRVPDPVETVQVASREAIGLGLTVVAQREGAAYRLLIDGFVPYAPAQEKLRNALGLNDSAGGSIVFIVEKK